MNEHPSNPAAEAYGRLAAEQATQAAELAEQINELIDQRARLDAEIVALQRRQLAAIEMEAQALQRRDVLEAV